METFIEYLPSAIDKVTKISQGLTSTSMVTIGVIIGAIILGIMVIRSNLFNITMIAGIIAAVYITYKFMSKKVNKSEKFDKWSYLHSECEKDKKNPLCKQYNEAYGIFENITDKMVNRFR